MLELVKSATDGVVEIFVSGQGAGRGGSALEGCGSEVAGLGIDPLRVLAVAVAERPVTADAKTPIEFLPARGMTSQMANMRFLCKGRKCDDDARARCVTTAHRLCA